MEHNLISDTQNNLIPFSEAESSTDKATVLAVGAAVVAVVSTVSKSPPWLSLGALCISLVAVSIAAGDKKTSLFLEGIGEFSREK